MAYHEKRFEIARGAEVLAARQFAVTLRGIVGWGVGFSHVKGGRDIAERIKCGL